ncbi:MAG TPA: hypothetical protein VEC14_11325 [Reyranellaceae bacterium]|nr:hypothetical protein [Reyranellaceae bacterium]
MSNVRDALEKLSATISSDPAKARAKNAPAMARLTQGLQCEVTGQANLTIAACSG